MFYNLYFIFYFFQEYNPSNAQICHGLKNTAPGTSEIPAYASVSASDIANKLPPNKQSPAKHTSSQKSSLSKHVASCSNYLLGESGKTKYDELAGEHHGYKEHSNVGVYTFAFMSE